MIQDVHFETIDAPLRLENAADVLDLLPRILPGWPYRLSGRQEAPAPFFTIARAKARGRFFCHDHMAGTAPRDLNAVNAVCDMVAAMSLALPESDDRLLCFHAAAVEMAGRLVVLPNARRAGKSTLTAELAMAGHGVFSDDFLPVRFDERGRLVGRALGIAPRLRLPLPRTLPRSLRTFARRNAVASNRQYGYLSLRSQPPNGRLAALGAMVLLDRAETGPATLAPVSPDAAMDTLLKQNFTRDRHSRDVLGVLARMLAVLPVEQLTYSDVGEAASLLRQRFSGWGAAPAEDPSLAGLRHAMAVITGPKDLPLPPESALVQTADATCTRIGEAIYLADAHGSAIHKLDGISEAIWCLLEEPITPAEIIAILGEAFSKVAHDVIAKDTIALLHRLHNAGLLTRA